MVFLVTGGAGFLGNAIVSQLMEDWNDKLTEVRVLDLKKPTAEWANRVRFIRGDIRDRVLMKEVCGGVDVVIHSAAVIDWGTKTAAEVIEINAGGTENLIHACKTNEVPILIYTSSLDAIFNGQSMENIDETIAYPKKPVNAYCASKQKAEELVRDANGEKMKTCILRPADIYGEGDPYHIGSLINMAKGGFYVRLGNGRSICQHVYVGNIAQAHLQVAEALLNKNQNVGGSTYFITDDPPQNFFSFYEQVVVGAGYSVWPTNFWLPFWLAYTIGSMFEIAARIIRPIKKFNPKFSRFAVIYTCSNFTFTSKKAEEDFGYTSKSTVDKAMERTILYYRNQRRA
jgi:nucleoside-diphosphate-sugar epimerase